MSARLFLRACAIHTCVLSLVGCMPASLPDCEDPDIVLTARQISIDSMMRDAASMPELQRQIRENLEIDVVDASTLSRAASGEEVRCAGTLWMRLRAGDRNPSGRGPAPDQRIPFAYRLSFNDRGEVWVEVQQ